ncbi:MAG: DUF4250 domain-containing protein [Clostridiales bacterium]|nr:DUF4250 domain-containing protein [Clostridiales bacterium]
MDLPKDPVMLLSFINMQLRDNYSSLTELTSAFGQDENQIKERLAAINYFYNEETNQFK